MVVMVVTIAILKAYDVVNVSVIWIFSPVWIPLAEAGICIFIKWLDKLDGNE